MTTTNEATTQTQEEESELPCDNCGSEESGYTFHASYNVSGWVKLCNQCLSAAQASRLATLEAAVKGQSETIEKLERVEKIAREIFNVVSTSAITRTAEACQHGNYAVPPMNHAWYCDKCWWEMHDALAETAPKVQS